MSQDSVRKARDLFVRAAEEYYSLKSGHAQYLLEKLVELGETDPDVAGLEIFPIANYQLGVIHTDQSADQAIEYFEKALSLGLEKNADLCRQLCCSYQVVGRNKEAIRILMEVIQYNEKDAMSRHFLGSAYLEMHQETKQLKFYLEAQRQNEILKTVDAGWVVGSESF